MPFAAIGAQKYKNTRDYHTKWSKTMQADFLPSEPPGKPSHIYNTILVSHKKEWNNTISSNMDATKDYHTKVKYVRKTNTIWCHLCVKSNIWQKWTYLQNRNRLTDTENRLAAAKWEGVGKGWSGRLGIKMQTTVYWMDKQGSTSLVAQTVKHLSTMWEIWVRSLGWEDSLEKEMATHSSTLALKIPWTEELGAGYYAWGCKELGTTERLHFTSLYSRGNYIQYSVIKHNGKEYWQN